MSPSQSPVPHGHVEVSGEGQCGFSTVTGHVLRWPPRRHLECRAVHLPRGGLEVHQVPSGDTEVETIASPEGAECLAGWNNGEDNPGSSCAASRSQ